MSILLDNGHLRIHLLHPEEDRPRLGVRYVHGGYIWQVETAAGEKLFSGPRFDRAEPPPYHGQGAPEAFRWFELLSNRRLNLHNGRGLCPGLGLIEDKKELMPTLLEAAPWTVETARTCCTMHSRAAHQNQGYALRREVALLDSGFASRTRIQNTGRVTLEIHWFPHPFFPHAQPSTLQIPGFTIPPDTAGYRMLPDGKIEITPEVHTPDGIFQMLDGPPATDLQIEVSHPLTGTVLLQNRFDCTLLPVWANRHTFSPEPHLIRMLEPGETAAWELEYRFSRG